MEGSGASELDTQPLSRRTLLKGVVGGALLAGAGLKSYEAIQNTPSKESLEKKFNIRLLNTAEAKAVINTERAATIPGNVEWDADRLGMVDDYLTALPQEFITPIDGKPIHLSLFGDPQDQNTNTIDMTPSMAGTIDTSVVPIIFLDQNKFRKHSGRKPFEMLAHEFIHLTKWDEAWDELPAINEILEGDFKDKKDELAAIFSDAQNFDHREGESEFDKSLRYDMAKSFSGGAFLADQPTEFIAYLGQYYVFGKENFLPTLTQIVGEEKATKLYDYAKNSLFFEREYDNFPVDAYTERRTGTGDDYSMEKSKMNKDEYR